MSVNYARIRKIVAEELEKNNAAAAESVWRRRINVLGMDDTTQPAWWFLNRTQRVVRFWLGLVIHVWLIGITLGARKG